MLFIRVYNFKLPHCSSTSHLIFNFTIKFHMNTYLFKVYCSCTIDYLYALYWCNTSKLFMHRIKSNVGKVLCCLFSPAVLVSTPWVSIFIKLLSFLYLTPRFHFQFSFSSQKEISISPYYLATFSLFLFVPALLDCHVNFITTTCICSFCPYLLFHDLPLGQWVGDFHIPTHIISMSSKGLFGWEMTISLPVLPIIIGPYFLAVTINVLGF